MKFVLVGLKGRALDDNRNQEAVQGRFPDFACLRDLLLIEMKLLKTDQNDRVNKVLDKTVNPAEKPVFYGSRDGQHTISRVSNGEQVVAALASKLSRTIETHLSNANSQFADYRSRNPRKNFVTICVILNSKLREFTPEFVLSAVHGKMKGSRFPDIDGVLYISEKHYAMLADGRMAFPVGIFHAQGAPQLPWKATVIELVMEKWSHGRTGGDVVPGDLHDSFDVIDDIPNTMPRHEQWRLEYKRRPYMSAVSDEQLKVIFNRCIAMAALSFLKGSWIKPAKSETAAQMRAFTHIIEETNRRGLDLRDVNPRCLSPEQQELVYSGLSQKLVDLLSQKPPTTGKAA